MIFTYTIPKRDRKTVVSFWLVQENRIGDEEMDQDVKIWILMYIDWLVGQIVSGEESFMIPNTMYKKGQEDKISEVLHDLSEVDATVLDPKGIRVFLLP